MDIKITDLAIIPQVISVINFDELKQTLEDSLVIYKEMVIDEKQVGVAKKERAAINALNTSLETKRKEIKNACLAPYNHFEKQVKELQIPIKNVISNIDKQTKAFEQNEKDKKRALLEKTYSDNAGTILDILPFERIFDEKWLLKSVKTNTAIDEIVSIIESVRRDLTAIDNMNHSHALQMKDKYLSTLNLSAALQEGERLKEIEKQLEERKASENERKRIAEEEKAKAEEYPFIAEPEPLKPQIRQDPEQERFDKTFTVIGVTQSELKSLGEYMRANGIKYR